MADLRFRQIVTGVTLAGTTEQTLIQLLAPTNQRVKLTELSVSFKGTSNTDAPVQVRLMVQTSAGTASSGTPALIDADMAETIQTASRITFTVEPSYSTVIGTWQVHPQTGLILPMSTIKPPVIKGGTRMALVALAPTTVTCSAYLECEE